MITSDVVPVLLRALVIGAFGGIGLVLTQIYSRRGPLIFPVYAALLAALALSLSRVSQLGFLSRFSIVLSAMVLATAMTFVATLVLARRQRRAIVASGHPLAPGHAPIWALPLLALILVTASAGVAYVSS